jgi:hypothetical protein
VFDELKLGQQDTDDASERYGPEEKQQRRRTNESQRRRRRIPGITAENNATKA